MLTSTSLTTTTAVCPAASSGASGGSGRHHRHVATTASTPRGSLKATATTDVLHLQKKASSSISRGATLRCHAGGGGGKKMGFFDEMLDVMEGGCVFLLSRFHACRTRLYPFVADVFFLYPPPTVGANKEEKLNRPPHPSPPNPHPSLLTNPPSPITHHRSPTTDHPSFPPPHPSRLTPRPSPLTTHPSPSPQPFTPRPLPPTITPSHPRRYSLATCPHSSAVTLAALAGAADVLLMC